MNGISRIYSGSMLRYRGRSSITNYMYHSTLETINKDLDEIAAQGRWKLRIFNDLNTTAVDGCLDHLSTALEKFKVCPASDIHGLGT